MKIFSLAEKKNIQSFQGFQHKKSSIGADEYEFNLPYDSTKYDAYLEVLNVERDNNGRQYITNLIKNKKNNQKLLLLNDNGTRINLKNQYGLTEKSDFAYRYVLKGKENNIQEKYVTDSGALINGEYGKYNLVSQMGSKIDKGGSMLLVIPDSYNVGWTYDKNGKLVFNKNIKEKAKHSTKTFSNKLGGTLAGLEQQIPTLKKVGYKRIVSTPVFTDDSLSAHSYWIKNAMQMSQSLGNINNYTSLIKAMYKADMNFVADGAFVNEGLEGVHFKDILNRGAESPYFNWFRADGVRNNPLAMGVFGKNHEIVSHKIVNSPYRYKQDAKSGHITVGRNPNYDRKKPTYFQAFDKTLASIEQKNDTQHLIKAYDKLNRENHTEINTHDDTLINYSFVINPKTYNENIRFLNEYNKDSKTPILIDSYKGTRILSQAENFSLEEKFEGGFEAWDANNDIAKLNFGFSKADVKASKSTEPSLRGEQEKEIIKRTYEVQDYAISAGKYWTKKTNDIVVEYTARVLKNISSNPNEAFMQINDIARMSNSPLPKSVIEKINKTVVQNVLDDMYKSKNIEDQYNKLLLSSIMALPLDSIEFGDDIVATLGYPYITNRATSSDTLGLSRYELFQNKNPHLDKKYEEVYEKANQLFTQPIYSFSHGILSDLDEKLDVDNKIFDGENVTEFGKHVISLVGPDIAKFIIVKALAPKIEVNANQAGEIIYDYEKLKTLSLKDIGITSLSPEQDAEAIVNRIKSGIKHLKEADAKFLVDSLYTRIGETNENSFKLAKAIVDRTQAGLDWRIDAAKDVADIDSIRNRNSDFEETWQNATSFWKTFNENVQKVNPNSYMAAEITDVGELHGLAGNGGRYYGSQDAEQKFLQETGINTTANYSYFFTDLAKIFAKGFEDGRSLSSFDRNKQIYNKLVTGDYLHSAQLESLLFSYTFAGNHDKPRALHCLALDMDLFHSKFDNTEHKKIATGILKNKLTYEVNDDDIKKVDFDIVSSKAIAMADTVKAAMGDSIKGVAKNNKEQNEFFTAISHAISDLAQGKFINTKFTPDAFGTKPFDVVIDMVIKQASVKHGLDLDKEQKEELINNTFEKMLIPSMGKFEQLMKFLVMLPGNPTLFAGDDLGLTGYEEKCKNIYLQNRSFLNWDSLNLENKKFIDKFHKQITHIMSLRSKPELKPLNTGTPYALAWHEDVLGTRNSDGKTIPVSGLLRQNTDGAMVISVFNPSGMSIDPKKAYDSDSYIKLDSISLRTESTGSGLIGGLKPGTTFYNINKEDKSLYKVCQDGESYFIKKFYDEDDYKKTNGKYNDSHQIDIFDPTLILYSFPEKKEVSFSGKIALHNTKYNFVSNPYAK